jgi:hypothetical protein
MMERKMITLTLACFLALALLIVPAMAVLPDDANAGIFRDSNGLWAIDTTGNFVPDQYYVLGMPGDLPVVGDGWSGIFRDSNGLWALDTTGDFVPDQYYVLGMPGDLPVVGDGFTGIFRDSNGLWALDTTGDFVPDEYHVLGMPGDLPVVGDGFIGIFRPSNGLWALDTTGDFVPDEYYVLGLEGDLPVVGESWTGIFRDSTGLWALDTTGDFVPDEYHVLGMPGDKPVVAFWTPTPAPLEVVSVEAINDITVPYGTAFDDLGLPVNVTATLDDSSIRTLDVEWDEGAYDPFTADTYALNGTLVNLPEDVVNPADVKAAVNVIVQPEDLFEVVSVEALSATTIQVEFAEGTVIEEADLEDQIIEVIADLLGAKKMDATYQAGTLNTTTLLANFSLAAGEGELKDAKTYFVQADWATFKYESFVARILKPYVASFVKVTLDVIAGANATVYFGALNQYGEDINLTDAKTIQVTGTLNGMPLDVGAGKELTYTSPSDNLTVNKTLAKNNALNLRIKNVDGADVLADTTLAYTVIEGAAPVATSFLITADKTTIAATKTVNFTATARDQYNNPFLIPDGTVRWTVGGETKLAAGNKTWENQFDQTGTESVVAWYVPGTLQSNAIPITVNQQTLTNFTLVDDNPATQHNQEAIRKYEITPVPAGAAVDSTKFGYNVITFPDGASASDLTITFEQRTGANASKAYAYITTQKAGYYTFNITHPVSSVATQLGNITTTINQTTTSITIEPIGENELTQSTSVIRNVTFYNKHNDKLNVTKENTTLNWAALYIDATRLNATKGAALDTENVTAVKVEGKAAGAAFVEVGINNSAVKGRIDFTVGGIAGVKTIDIANTVEVIKQDDFNDAENQGILFADGKAFRIMPVTFKNQYGNAMDITKDDIDNAVNQTQFNVTPLRTDPAVTTSGNFTIATGGADKVTGFGVYAEAAAKTNDNFTVNVNSNKQATGYSNVKVIATVKDARNVTTFDLSKTSEILTIGGANSKIYITTWDQYSKPRTVDPVTVINITSSNDNIVKNTTVTFVSGKVENYMFDLQPQSVGGSANVNVNITGGNTNVKPTDNDKKIAVTVTQGLKSGSAPDLVSGKADQKFNNLNFTLVGELGAGKDVKIDLSNLVAAGVDFSAFNATQTKAASVNATNFTMALSQGTLTLIVDADKTVAHETPVTVNLRDKDGKQNIVDVNLGATGTYEIPITRSDSAAAGIKAETKITESIYDASADHLQNNETNQLQNFFFKLDGAMPQNRFVEVAINGKGVRYSIEPSQWSVSGVSGALTQVTESNGIYTARVRSNTDLADGSAFTVTCFNVSTTDVSDEPIHGTVKRVTSGNEAAFDFKVGAPAFVARPVKAEVDETKITGSFLSIANDNTLNFTLAANTTTAGDFKVNLTDFVAPFGTTDGTFIIGGANVGDGTINVHLKHKTAGTTNATEISIGDNLVYNITKGTYDYISISGKANDVTSFISITFINGKVTGVSGAAPYDVTFMISEATNIDTNKPVTVTAIVNLLKTATEKITLI